MVVNTFERPETEEEKQKRLAQAEDEKKKTGKKAPPSKGKAEEGEVKTIKEVVLDNLTLDGPFPKYVKWATSQIQFIKDRSIRDVNVFSMNLMNYVLVQRTNLEENLPTKRWSACL